MIVNREAEIRSEVAGSGIKPLRTLKVLPAVQLGKFYFNEQTGMIEITGIEARFNSNTGILEVTDRSEIVYAKIQALFDSIRSGIPEADGINLQPPPMRVSRTIELAAA